MSSNAGLLPRALEVGPHRWLRWLWLPVAFALVAIGLWWLGHPQALTTPDRTESATTKAGRSVYLGVTNGAQAGRELTVKDVDIPKASAPGVTVKAWICKGGSIAETTDPTQFCTDVVEAEGNDLRLGTDQLILSVESPSAAKVEVGRVTVNYREGLQRAEQPVGPTYSVEFIG
ncbi:MAG TPA: hypothetical protein VIR30_18605 [Nocardioides sp.]